jgi:hypothetical protein
VWSSACSGRRRGVGKCWRPGMNPGLGYNEVCTASPTIFFQYLVSWPLFSHLLEEYNLLCLHTSPLMQN